MVKNSDKDFDDEIREVNRDLLEERLYSMCRTKKDGSVKTREEMDAEIEKKYQRALNSRQAPPKDLGRQIAKALSELPAEAIVIVKTTEDADYYRPVFRFGELRRHEETFKGPRIFTGSVQPNVYLAKTMKKNYRLGFEIVSKRIERRVPRYLEHYRFGYGTERKYQSILEIRDAGNFKVIYCRKRKKHRRKD